MLDYLIENSRDRKHRFSKQHEQALSFWWIFTIHNNLKKFVHDQKY